MSSLYRMDYDYLPQSCLRWQAFSSLVTQGLFFSTRSLSGSLFQKHFSKLDMKEVGRYNRLSRQVSAVNIPLVLKKLVHPLVCMKIRKAFRSISKTNSLWLRKKSQKTPFLKGWNAFRFLFSFVKRPGDT